MKRAATGIIVVGLATIGTMVATPAAYAANDIPGPGYFGPVNNCPGTLVDGYFLKSASGVFIVSALEIWYTPSGNGTYCAMTKDYIEGRHHMEVVVRRAGWTTIAWESGNFDFYAGGIEVFGPKAGAEHSFFFGRVTYNGVNYERRVECFASGSCVIIG